MIKLVNGRIRWGEEDVAIMAKILGPDQAVSRAAPYNPAILRLTDRILRKMTGEYDRRRAPYFFDMDAHHALRKEVAFRKRYRQLKKASNAVPRTELEERFKPHQRADLAYMRETRLPAYLLASQPGVGKTLVAIRWMLEVAARRVLVITPNSAKRQWRDELERWYDGPLDAHIVEGSGTQQILTAQKQGIIIGHWESLVHARLGYLTHPWDLVIADEAHHAQNRKAQRTDTLFALEAAHRLALTAHPFSKSPDDFFSILKFLYPERYTSFWRFFNMHVRADPKPFGGYTVQGTRRPKLLRWEIAPFTLRRTKASLGWAKPIHVRRTVQLTPRGRKEYEEIKRKFFAELEGMDGAKKLPIPSALARVTRLRQYPIDPRLLGAKEASQKYPVVLEILDEIDGPAIIFSMFQQAGRALGEFLTKQKKRVAFIDGQVTTTKRDEAKKKFLAGKLDAVIITEAGGEALNLGKYGYVIFLDLPWHPRGFEQVLGRVDRPEEGTGKKVTTTAYRIITEDTYEPRMEARLSNRHLEFSKTFTVAQLKELFG